MSAAPWPAPAKINLFLHVTGRRPDGYHDIQTLFQLIDLADELRIAVRRDGVIARVGGPAEVAPETDLVVMAARLLREVAGDRSLGADLALSKRIPIGGGLGGGSSDAATALVALNEVWGLGLGTERLAALARVLGADVPVFVHGTAAIGRGIGEILEPVELAPASFAIIFPGVSVATADAFQAPELTRNSPVITISGFLLPDWPLRALPGRNDLEAVVAERQPVVRAALEWLGRRGQARLTGSGASVFAAFRDRAAAQSALAGLPVGWTGFVAAALGRSPLAARVAAERRAGLQSGAT
ncbi:MAG TPA: 4-(cytidine 5'-diphospho)-2-C-methyl-D-erythritol kinase [Steroidobacteraceae bacterium]|nr:4-(cytidine 5'-diphospho)-2-C-methyl-D-erythritol kinase [Steroidobacteraceae bacterium]